MHHGPLIAIIVMGLGLAFVFGALAQKLRVSPLVGYLLAGVAVGPFTPGFVADQNLANDLAEIGVILLMFGVGLHFSLKDLLSVKAIAVPGALVQIGTATLLGLGLALLLGWSVPAGLVFGLALSVASTVVLLRALQERRIVQTEKGKIAVGWLIVEDLAMVLALVMIPAVADVLNGGSGTAAGSGPLATRFDLGLWGVLGLTLAKVAAFVAFMLIVGRRLIPWILHWVAHTGSRELFRLAVLAIALGVAYLAASLFGVSFALGAFFAGMILSESPLSHRAAEESLPLRDAFAVLFFVSVGMLFDPGILLRAPLPLIATIAIILFGKTLAAWLIVRAFGKPDQVALTISASLAQIGEFSFILAGLGVSLKLLPEQGRDLILAGAIFSIVLNPLMFKLVDRFAPPDPAPAKPRPAEPKPTEAVPVPQPEAPATTPEPEPAPTLERDIIPTELSDHIVVVGYGRVGSLLGAGLAAMGEKLLVIEDQDDGVAAARRDGAEVLVGNAADPEVLDAAGLARAKRLFVAIPGSFEAGQVCEQARKQNPNLPIIARAHSLAEVEHLRECGASRTIMGEAEIARAMLALCGRKGEEPAPSTPNTA
ncbi:putative monovalent cation:proton antiporter (CPA2 family) [Bosea sp. 62]|uniref:cation:proton antiporter domain-containing protein n=1 Tax=unclassified Bosea (in: a-proteobacteria) TaxID=2653178 RepID=UPI0012580530|nr:MULTISPECIES: cation:proton antiporter [unclassified Bosea (in: a-proteobacteria)]CAD5252787.1 putative monovalent cation:proton antiporter (CPA2 family) [Bosea sp. 7B]CAD5278561.1 putative monovalent cation:proton antiporter (CPA2 family) [Bosea sp. 21B]CAD5279656.1 putative monovalent cation:proton antiporter (CPA2 family) [Bosea sp. 46]VVT59639.1 putative monovalent cation:proton antiporter (CPA2 family) [Bosea sp. EC-HK365B]VXB37335.1 putative monovalent cation:proton antiporter (CPA2 f